jgi:hypothetical protein
VFNAARGGAILRAGVSEIRARVCGGDNRFEPELIERQSTTERARLNRYGSAGD